MAHIHEKIDFTVTVYIVHENKVLLRLHDKYHDWFGVGGHVELDEDVNTAAIRECLEEVGLAVTLVPPPQWKENAKEGSGTELIPPLFLNIHHVNPEHQHQDLIFAATCLSDLVKPEHPEDKWLWLTEEELTAHPEVSGSVKHYASEILKLIRERHS